MLVRNSDRNKDIIFPYLTADDICSRPDASPSRYIINFRDWTLEEAEAYPDCLAIVRNTVKPERDLNNRASRRERWWRFGEVAPGLYEAIAALDRVIVFPIVSKVLLPLMYHSGIVFSHSVAVIARDDYDTFGILSSHVHRSWARRYSSTLESRPRYSPSDCFLTFPFPSASAGIAVVTEQLIERVELMRGRALSLTGLYNLVHNCDGMESKIVAFRNLHAALDRAVCDAYSWDDLDLNYGFHETDEGIRWTMGEATRTEVLDRLLELNHERHREEEERGVAGTSAASANGERARKRKAPSSVALKRHWWRTMATKSPSRSNLPGNRRRQSSQPRRRGRFATSFSGSSLAISSACVWRRRSLADQPVSARPLSCRDARPG